MQPPDSSRIPSARSDDLEVIFQCTPVGMCMVDPDLRIVRVNAAYAQIFDLSPDALLGRSLRESLPDPIARAVLEGAEQVLETREPLLAHAIQRIAPGLASRREVFALSILALEPAGAETRAVVVLRDVTQVHAIEEADRERRNEIESLYRNAPVGLAYTDRELRYVRINQQIADMNGVPIEAMIGKTYREMAPDSAGVAEPFLRHTLEHGTSVRNLEVHAAPPGNPDVEHVYLLNLEPVRNADGEVIGQVSAVQDVTKLRRWEIAAANRLVELEALYANAPIGLCYLDADLRIVHLNPLFAQLSERPLEGQIGLSAREALPDELAGQILPHLEYVARSGQPSLQAEVRGGTPSTGSREFTWTLNVHPVKSEAGDPSGIITVLQDISLLASQQRDIAAVRDRLVQAQSVARMGSWEWDLIADVVWWSEELYSIFGVHRAHVPSYDSFFDLVHPEDRQRVRDQIERTLTADEPYRVTFQLVRPDGAERLIFASAQLERTPHGVAAKLVGTCLDVTDPAARPRVRRAAQRRPRGGSG